jgi:endonuclease III
MSSANEGEWERPIGLTAEHAICVDDSSSSDSNNDENNNEDKIEQKLDVKSNNRTRFISSYFNSSMRSSSNEPERPASISVCARKISGSTSEGFSRDNDMILPPPSSDRATTEKNDSQNGSSNMPSKIRGDNIDDNEIDKSDPSQRGENNDNQNDNISSNPFAAFAFQAEETSSISIKSKSWPSKKRILESTSKTSSSMALKSKKQIKSTTQSIRQQDKVKSSWSIADLHAESTKSKNLNEEEYRQELITKWHSFSDENAPLEERRFQVLIAARIHARCQEKVVSQAMQRLREYFAQKETADDGQHNSMQSLSPQYLAQCDPETDIAPLLSSVLFGNVKAQHIVLAAQDVLSKFRGQVPESMVNLKDITGIGPKLAAILNIVNRRDTYSSQS